MRFILSFIFFGLLFYGIYLYLPETFNTLVSWAGELFNFLKDSVEKVTDKVHVPSHSTPEVTKP